MMRLFCRRKLINVCVLIVTSIILISCGSAVRSTYDLTIPDTISPQTNQKRTQILIASPEAVKSLDGQDIVIREDGGNIYYLKGAQWSDRLPNLVQARLLQAFENSRKFAGVGRPGEGLAIDYQVLTEIRRFDVSVTNNQKIAHIEIAVKIMNDSNGVIRASRVFSIQRNVNSSVNSDGVSALDSAFREIIVEIVNWTLKQI